MSFEKLCYQLRNWRAHWRSFWQGSALAIENFSYWIENKAAQLEARELRGGRRGFLRVSVPGRMVYKGTLAAKVIRKNGKVIDYGVVAKRVVTTAGVNYMRDDFAAGAGSADISNFKYHAMGTGTNAEAIGDTALQTEVESRVAGTQDNSVSKQYKTIATISATAGRAITEHGIFSASSTGTLWDRSVFSVLNLLIGDSIQFTYTLTISDGG